MSRHPLDRREFLRRSGLALTAAALGGRALAQEAAPEFSFLAINDSHWKDEHCAAYFQGAFAWAKENAEYDFVLMCGDLATGGALAELQGMRAALDLLGKPAYPVVGNHDWSEGQRNWAEVFGEDRLNYRFDHQGWTFLGLDTTHKAASQDVAVSEETVAWLTAALAEIPPERPLVAFSHFPFGGLVPMRLTNADEVLELFAGHNLKHIFSGHFHGLTERTHGDTGLTTCRCCSFSRDNHDGTPEKGFLQCRVRGEELTHEFVEYKPEA